MFLALLRFAPHQSLRDSFSRLPARSLLLLRRGVHWTPATPRGSLIWDCEIQLVLCKKGGSTRELSKASMTHFDTIFNRTQNRPLCSASPVFFPVFYILKIMSNKTVATMPIIIFSLLVNFFGSKSASSHSRGLLIKLISSISFCIPSLSFEQITKSVS